jgi:hypothetical protein
MKPEGHLRKAEAFENRAERMEGEQDAPSVIEDIFDAMVHYIAYGINKFYHIDIDSHSGQKRFLRENGKSDILDDFNEMERIRIGSVYGSKWNGEQVRRAKEVLGRVKEWIKETGGHR